MSAENPQPRFVLMRPQMGENIGAAARAMWNFGLDHMRVIAPRDGWPSASASAMASGAGRLLDEAVPCADLDAAIGDCSWVVATTARPRELSKPVLSPEAAMQEAAARIAGGERVAVLFGPERAGLENEDVARANAIMTVPVNPAFPSLNLAQCVLLAAYEWRRATQAVVPRVEAPDESGWASAREIEHLAGHYESQLDEAGLFYPEDKAAQMKLGLRNLWSRLALTSSDVRLLHGILRQMARWKERG